MRKLLIGLLIAGLIAGSLSAQSSKNQPVASGLPPLIDRELIFGNPEIAGAQLSPNGRYLAFLKPWKDTRNIYVKGVNEPFSAARLLTTETKQPIANYFWSRDSKYIFYIKDNNGDENYNAYAVDPSAKPAAGAEAPASRDLTGMKGLHVQVVNVSKNDPDVIYIGLNDRDRAWPDLYKLKISTGEKALVHKNTDRISTWQFDLKDQLRMATRSAENGDHEILRVDSDSFTKVFSCSVFETCATLRFHKDGKRVYLKTNHGSDVDLTSLVLFDPGTGKTEMVESDPLKKVDLDEARFSEASDELALTTYFDDHQRRYYRDKGFEADLKWLESKLPHKQVSISSDTLDEQTWLISASSDTEPSEAYLFDRKTRKFTLQYKLREKLPRENLAEMKAVSYRSSDGLEIPAYLTLPKGVPAKGLPVLVMPHGGPWTRSFWGYNTLVQFLANRGYAVLQPNYRASVGYGKKYVDAGNMEWGRKMQDDITWGVKYLVSEGIADPKRVGILGASYGGYATLAGVTFTPDLYAAAVDIVGPSNLSTLLEAIPAYWEADRVVLYKRMGDLRTAEGKALLNERSPLNYADRIKTPLLIAQGANDPRVNKREADQIVVALRDRGYPVEYLVAPDEGHGFARPVNTMALYLSAEKFLAKHLGGRYQEGGKPEVVARLGEITVDPKSVVLAKKKEADSVALPRPAADLKPGTWKYKATVVSSGHETTFNLSTDIKETGNTWTAVDTMQGPMGLASDTATLEKGTLVLRKRTLKGPATIDLTYTDSKATGTMSIGGRDTQIAADLGGPIFAETGAPMSIACLPLAEGYTASFRNFDVGTQKEKLLQLKVVGSESVTVAAGTFDAFKVEITPTANGGYDHQTLWIAKDSRKAVKISTVKGPGTLTVELVP